jgi:hypothetical protein
MALSSTCIMAARQTKLITMLATKLRLLPRAQPARSVVVPWEKHA